MHSIIQPSNIEKSWKMLKKIEKCWFYVEMLKQSWLYVETMLIMYVDFSFQHWKIVDVEKVKSDSKCWKSVELVLKKKTKQKIFLILI